MIDRHEVGRHGSSRWTIRSSSTSCRILRDVDTGAKDFRELVKELAMLMAYEATRDFQLAETVVTTPITETTTQVLAGKKVAVIPILRAGLGMVDGILELIPAARVGHVGLYRDPETLEPVEYYCKLPEDIGERDVLIVDPMLATGGSASAAVEFLRKRGARSIKLLVLIAAPEGIERVRRRVRGRHDLHLRRRRPPQRPRLHRARVSATPATGCSARSSGRTSGRARIARR